jgi:hypothetical protein
MFNYCFIGGQVSARPEIILQEGGQGEVLFEMAIWRGVGDSAGFVRVLCLQQLATVASRHLKKGDWVVVVGYLHRGWMSVRGTVVHDLYLVARSLEIVIRVVAPEGGDMVPVG